MPTLLYKLTISFFLLSAAQLISSKASSQDTINLEREGDRSRGEKITLVIDGDQVILNGKTIVNLADVQVDVARIQRNVERGVRTMERKLRAMERDLEGATVTIPPVPPVPPVYFGNKARLGVYTEKDEKGARVTKIVEGSPAQKAGLQVGDIITDVDKKNISGPSSLSEIISDMNAGDKVGLKYIRNKKQHKASTVLDGHPSQSFRFQGEDNFAKGFKGLADAWGKPQLGIRIQDTEEGEGVKVLELDSESMAARAGIEKDDLIIAIDGNTVKTTDDARRQLAAVKNKPAYQVRVKRGDSQKEIEVKNPQKLKTADL